MFHYFNMDDVFTEVKCPPLKPLSFGTVHHEGQSGSHPKTFSFLCNDGFELYPEVFSKIKCVQTQKSVGEWQSVTSNKKLQTAPVCFGESVLETKACTRKMLCLQKTVSYFIC